MLNTKTSLDEFVRDAMAIARVFPAGELFSLLNRQVVVPPTCAALVWGAAAQPVVIAGGRVLEAAGVREVLLSKTLPVWLEYQFTGMRSGDDHDCAASLRLAVQVVPERDELIALRRSILGSANCCDAGALRRFFEEAVRAATILFVRRHDAAILVSPCIGAEFDAVLSEHFKPVGFETGMALGRDPRASFSSSSLAAAQRAAETQALRAQRITADETLRTAANEGRRKQLSGVASLVDEAKRLAAATPGVSVAEVIRKFDAAQRGELYRGLLSPGERCAKTRAILVVAGEELIWLDPAGSPKPIRRQTFPAAAGPLRSVRLTRDGLQQLILVGARRGVHVVDTDEGPRGTYLFEPGRELRGGVNSAAIHRDRLYATHSEMGLLCWQLIKADAAEACLADVTRGAKSIREARVEGDQLIFAADRQVIAWTLSPGAASNPPPPPRTWTAPSAVQCLESGESVLYAGLDDGSIARAESSTAGPMELIRPGGGAGPVHSLIWLPGGGIPRLLIADRRPHLSLLVLGEPYHAEYRWNQPLRWAAAAVDLVLGVSDARDQLVLWRPELPEEPIASVSIGRLCGQPVQDVCLLPGPLPSACL